MDKAKKSITNFSPVTHTMDITNNSDILVQNDKTGKVIYFILYRLKTSIPNEELRDELNGEWSYLFISINLIVKQGRYVVYGNYGLRIYGLWSMYLRSCQYASIAVLSEPPTGADGTSRPYK